MKRLPLAAPLLLAGIVLAQQPAAPAGGNDAARGAFRARLRDRLAQRAAAAQLQGKTWTVHGTERTAWLHLPDNPDHKPLPLIFVFHGHGGSGKQAALSFHLHTLWPEALIVYPDGLPSQGMTDPEGKKNGWETQRASDHARDLDFFDAMLASLRKDYPIDDKAIFATGHSNGGSMTYLLWARRGDTFAAVAPSASIAGFLQPELKPKPALILAGETDTVVPYPWQERNLQVLKTLFHIPAHPTTRPLQAATEYDTTPPLLTLLHPGGHELAPEGPQTIVAFFKQVAASTASPAPTRRQTK